MHRARVRVRELVRALARNAAAPVVRPQTAPLLVALLAAIASGCSGGSSAPAPNVGYGLALHAAGGVYDDGSGCIGLAVLSTLRDANGAGPTTPWLVSFRDEAGALPLGFQYGAGA